MQIAVRSGGEGQSQMLTNEAGEVRVMRYACEARDGRYLIAAYCIMFLSCTLLDGFALVRSPR